MMAGVAVALAPPPASFSYLEAVSAAHVHLSTFLGSQCHVIGSICPQSMPVCRYLRILLMCRILLKFEKVGLLELSIVRHQEGIL